MNRKLLRRWLPSEHHLREHRYLRRLAPLWRHSSLFQLNRHAVARGVAMGAIGGLIPGPLQMLTAALLAVLFRGNLPVAVFTTLYTNPLTIVPLYLLAYRIGRWLQGESGGAPQLPALAWHHPWDALVQTGAWAASLGSPLLLGLAVLAGGLAVLGYAGVLLLWRIVVAWRWRQRRRARDPARTP